jgi:diguanylate cyclase (GGDEF)-like protein
LALAAAGWAALSFVNAGPANAVVNGAVMIALVLYALIAASSSRRRYVDDEKRLRMEILVHSMELEKLATRDDLTQLYNRRYFFERLEREMQTARSFQRPLALILLDLDGLKSVNDTRGHRAGDRALANFGKLLLAQTRASDVPARIGGDEFAIILPDTTQAAADAAVARLHVGMEGSDLLDEQDGDVKVWASLGVAGYPWDAETADELVQQADAAMYANKRERKKETADRTGEGIDVPVPSILGNSAAREN